jgi:hypothetical protein
MSITKTPIDAFLRQGRGFLQSGRPRRIAFLAGQASVPVVFSIHGQGRPSRQGWRPKMPDTVKDLPPGACNIESSQPPLKKGGMTGNMFRRSSGSVQCYFVTVHLEVKTVHSFAFLKPTDWPRPGYVNRRGLLWTERSIERGRVVSATGLRRRRPTSRPETMKFWERDQGRAIPQKTLSRIALSIKIAQIRARGELLLAISSHPPKNRTPRRAH